MNYQKKGLGALACAVSTLIALCAIDARVLAQTSNSPVAFVYVSSSPSSNNYEINAYAAASNGRLTAISGSPFVESGTYMAINGKWLFSTDGVNIYSFSIASTGALKQVSSINAQQYNGYNDGGPVNLFLDHTGATLYDEDIYGNIGANNTYQFFDINPTTGALSYLGATSTATPAYETPLSFIANNEYAYGASCYHGDQTIYGFSRSGTGVLTDLNLTPTFPIQPKGGYCPYLAVADPTNNIAVSLEPTDDGLSSDGLTQIGVYTADSSGNLTTISTYANMPKVAVGAVIDMSMSPSGKLLAVSGSTGLQMFHFNGASPVTHYTGLMAKVQMDQMFWDNANHLYAISPSAGKLYVFTATPTSVVQAPGSPYTITSPESIIVLPKS